MKYAVLVIDVLNDFVTGELKCERAASIVSPIVKLINKARKEKVPVIFCSDAHLDNDKEFKVWGPHAIKGSKGAEVIPELNLNEEIDYVISKRNYSSFFETKLNNLLKELNINTIILVGLQAHICVQHTAADAFQYGYDIIAATDCIEAFTQEAYDAGIKYIHDMYGAKLLTSDEIIKLL